MRNFLRSRKLERQFKAAVEASPVPHALPAGYVWTDVPVPSDATAARRPWTFDEEHPAAVRKLYDWHDAR